MSKFRLTPSFRVRRTMRSPAGWLTENARYGDLVLTGGTDQISRLIQIATGGIYSHTMVVVEDNMVIEAHDRAEESTGGIFRTPFDDMFERDGVSRVSLFRLPELDADALRVAIDEMERTSPSFDSAGIILLGAVRTFQSFRGRIARRVKFRSGTPARLVDWAVALTGDGLHRMHCAELVTRLYMRAGVPLAFKRPTFMHLINGLDHCDDANCPNPIHQIDFGTDVVAINSIADLAASAPDVASLPNKGVSTRNLAPVTHLSDAKGRLAQFRRTASGRLNEGFEPDQADFVVPSDYADARPFEWLGTLECVDGTWRHAKVEAHA